MTRSRFLFRLAGSSSRESRVRAGLPRLLPWSVSRRKRIAAHRLWTHRHAWIELLEQRNLLAADYGDAPDPASGASTGNYETTAANGGPSHTIVAGLFLGDSVDGDSGALQNAAANADDVDAALPDDEDGVLSPLDSLGTIGAQPTVTLLATNDTGSVATLSGWIDYNQDGLFDNGTERAQAAVPSGTTDGRFTLTFPKIPSSSAGQTYARFRLSTDPSAGDSTGAASDGEVEDYKFLIADLSPGTVKNHVKISDGLAGFNPTGLDAYDGFGRVEKVTATKTRIYS